MRVSNDDRSEIGAGKTYRMGRIFGASGRTLVLPADHGLTLGRVEGLGEPVGRLEDRWTCRATAC